MLAYNMVENAGDLASHPKTNKDLTMNAICLVQSHLAFHAEQGGETVCINSGRTQRKKAKEREEIEKKKNDNNYNHEFEGLREVRYYKSL